MALGILFIALRPGYPPDLNSYLFGNILSVTKSDLLLIFLVTVVVAAATVLFFNHWKAYLFDDEFAEILGIKTAFFRYFLLVLVAVTIVALIRVVGIILVLALLCAPAASAGLLSARLKNRMIISVLLGFFFCISGLWLSYEVNIASGAAIVIFSVSCYIALYIFRAVFACSKKKRLISGKVGAADEP
jgi:zinc transport system permease protein